VTTAEVRAGKVAAAKMTMATAEVHVATAMPATMATAAPGERDTARRERCGNDQHNNTSMDFRHRSLPPATHDITDQPKTTRCRRTGFRPGFLMSMILPENRRTLFRIML
jgi:hypothetical protein